MNSVRNIPEIILTTPFQICWLLLRVIVVVLIIILFIYYNIYGLHLLLDC